MQKSSLLLIAVDRMEVTTDKTQHGKARYLGGFQYGTLGYNYKFVITDPAFEERHANKADKFWVEQPISQLASPTCTKGTVMPTNS